KFPYRPHTFHKPVTVCLIGQIAPHKGHEDAIEAVRVLRDGFHLLIAGKGDRSYEEKLKSQAAGLPVEFVGTVRVPEFFERVDILIVPSWDEPFGIVSLEAMASGIPVIATGPKDVVYGALIPPRNPSALADAIRSLKPGDYVKQARTYVEEKFDLK